MTDIKLPPKPEPKHKFWDSDACHYTDSGGFSEDQLDAFARAAVELQPDNYHDAYTGAREEMNVWKRRALEAEATLRKEQEIISRLCRELNSEGYSSECIAEHEAAYSSDKEIAELRAQLAARRKLHDIDLSTGHADVLLELANEQIDWTLQTR